jgi:hypothetical protein
MMEQAEGRLMGLDLKVMVSSLRERRNEMLPTATLRFDRDAGLFGRLASDATPCLVRPLPDGLKVGSYEDEGLQYIDADRYGNRLTWTTSADIRLLVVSDDTAEWNRAVLAFLLALPSDSRIVLYWC